MVQTAIVRMIYHLSHDDRDDRKISASADVISGVVWQGTLEPEMTRMFCFEMSLVSASILWPLQPPTATSDCEDKAYVFFSHK